MRPRRLPHEPTVAAVETERRSGREGFEGSTATPDYPCRLCGALIGRRRSCNVLDRFTRLAMPDVTDSCASCWGISGASFAKGRASAVSQIPAADRAYLLEVLTSDEASRAETIGNLHVTGRVPETVELLMDAEEDPALRALLVGILWEIMGR